MPTIPNNCQVPLWLEWVKEWYDTARERNTKGVTTYRNAYDNLMRCPVQFEHPSELQQIRGWGPKLCERLARQLETYCAENNLPVPQNPSWLRKRKMAVLTAREDPGEAEQADAAAQPTKKARKTKPYVPEYRSGGYAILLALALADGNEQIGFSKAELIELAQPHCKSSFTVPPDTSKYYTAWKSVETLERRELVYSRGRPTKRYALTDEGWQVAERVKERAQADGQITRSMSDAGPASGSRSTNDAARRTLYAPVAGVVDLTDEPNPPENDSQRNTHPVGLGTGRNSSPMSEPVPAPGGAALPTFEPIVLKPGSYTVEMVLDTREIRAKKDRDYMQNELTKKGIKPIMRSLEVGDVLWVAKCRDPDLLKRNQDGIREGRDEVMLDWIVERKRLDDLIGSIKDGRFHDQKFRLRRSQVRNVVYLIEEIALDKGYLEHYEESVQSAIASTQVVSGYFVKKTRSMDESIRYLARLTWMLQRLYQNKTLHAIPSPILTPKNYHALLHHLRETQSGSEYYVSYPAFAALASKSGNLTLRDMFLKMLMCTKSLTGEKAIEIQKHWATPYAFVKSFEQCGDEEEGKKRKLELVSNRMRELVGRKKIAKVLSEKIARVWGDV